MTGARAASTPPEWMQQLAERVRSVDGEQLSRFLPPGEGGRQSAVLMLFADGPRGPDVLLIQRASTLRDHPGQPAFPGGAIDSGDDGPVAAALREAVEEVGLDAATVDVLATMPALYIPVTGYVVTPVLAWWRTPGPVAPVDAGEVAAVERVPVSVLADPARRLRVQHPSGWVGPAFDAHGLLIWGFTAGLLTSLLALGGWERPWDPGSVRELPGPGGKLPEAAAAPNGTVAAGTTGEGTPS